jgi:fermentation-respiration switch protein FrsA (DUF1100 family)
VLVVVGFLLVPFVAAPGFAGLLNLARPGELVVTVYFLGSVSLVIFLILAALRWLGRLVDAWLNGPCPERPSWGRVFLRNDLPVVLLLPLCAPYLLAVSYAHRGKAPNIENPQEVLGRPCEDVTFTTSDGLTLRGWFIPATKGNSQRTLVVCHGLGTNRSFVLPWYPLGDALDANLFVFDFRGHGTSDGHTVTYGCREKLDVLAAIQYLRAERPEQAREIIGLGTSLGAASLALGAAEVEPPLDAVILDSSYASALELTETVLRHIPAVLRPALEAPGVPLASLHADCDLREARPIDVIDRLRAPVLFIHAADDKLIPVEHSRRLYERAAGPKELWITDTGCHCSAWTKQKEYIRRCKELVERREQR